MFRIYYDICYVFEIILVDVIISLILFDECVVDSFRKAKDYCAWLYHVVSRIVFVGTRCKLRHLKWFWC